MRAEGSAKEVDRDSMEAGQRYHVTFQDCGLEGEFTATFLGWGRYDWDDSESDEAVLVPSIGLYDGAEFSLWDNGVRLGPVEGFWTAYRAGPQMNADERGCTQVEDEPME